MLERRGRVSWDACGSACSVCVLWTAVETQTRSARHARFDRLPARLQGGVSARGRSRQGAARHQGHLRGGAAPQQPQLPADRVRPGRVPQGMAQPVRPSPPGPSLLLAGTADLQPPTCWPGSHRGPSARERGEDIVPASPLAGFKLSWRSGWAATFAWRRRPSCWRWAVSSATAGGGVSVAAQTRRTDWAARCACVGPGWGGLVGHRARQGG